MKGAFAEAVIFCPEKLRLGCERTSYRLSLNVERYSFCIKAIFMHKSPHSLLCFFNLIYFILIKEDFYEKS